MFKAGEVEDGNIGGFIQLRVQLLHPVKQHSLSPTQLWHEKSMMLLLYCFYVPQSPSPCWEYWWLNILFWLILCFHPQLCDRPFSKCLLPCLFLSLSGWETSWNIDDWIRLSSTVKRSQAAREWMIVHVLCFCFITSLFMLKAGVGKNGNVDDTIESTSTLSSVKHPSTKLIFYFLLCFQSHSARELLIICPDPGFRLRVQGWCDGNIDDLIQHILLCKPPLPWAHFYLLNVFLSFTLLLEALVFKIKNRGSRTKDQSSRTKNIYV